MFDTKSKGNVGEDFAVRILKNKGYKIIQRNFRSKLGEIDIIAKNGGYLSFIEVKTRWNKKYGKPEEAVTSGKINKIKRVIDYYLLLHPENYKKIKIEVVAIDASNGNISSYKIIKFD